jgi:hypothetical protein
MSPIEFRNGGAIKECQAMELSELIRDFVIMTVDLADPVHRPDLQNPTSQTVSISHLALKPAPRRKRLARRFLPKRIAPRKNRIALVLQY